MKVFIYKRGANEPLIAEMEGKDAEQLVLNATLDALNNTRWADRPPYIEHLIYAVRSSDAYTIYEGEPLPVSGFYYHKLAKRYKVLAIHRNIDTK